MINKVITEREISLPDDLRVARALSAPHLGPRILFFSGGSALNGVSRVLKRYTFNSTHLITPFDSGGSSQILRQAFDMPAVGDLRSRLMALADETDLGQPDIYALFSHRLSKQKQQADLHESVLNMTAGTHPLTRAIPQPMRLLIQGFLSKFMDAAGTDFDYRGASIGNLILAGGYLANDRQLEPVLFLMSKMVDVRGTVRAVVDVNLQLGAELVNGRHIIGQREMSGKEAPPLECAIKRLFLSNGEHEITAKDVPLSKRNRKLIGQADLICYPPGSLYSSVIANLLPAGVGRAIAARCVPKVYVPSLGNDPEARDLRLVDQVQAVLHPMAEDSGAASEPSRLMTHVICDEATPEDDCKEVSKRYGIMCLRLPLKQVDRLRYDPEKLTKTLLSFI